MGLFKSREEKDREEMEIKERIRNSECTRIFVYAFSAFFNEGDEHYQWLLANSKERMYEFDVFRDGVILKQIEVNRDRYKQTGTYDVASEGFGFGAAGFEDLPNSKYVWEFKWALLNAIKENCPNVVITDSKYIRLGDNVKKGW